LLQPITADEFHRMRTVRPPSHHFGLPQLRDLICAEAELGEYFFGLLAEFRWPSRHFAGGARQRNGLADETDMTVLGIWHVLRDAEMSDLGIPEHLVE
jgi:hypothetical protein